jgi:hypothetical protein
LEAVRHENDDDSVARDHESRDIADPVEYLALQTAWPGDVVKGFMADGLDPTCLSGTHLRLITDMSGPFLFGRDDLRSRARDHESRDIADPVEYLALQTAWPGDVVKGICSLGAIVDPVMVSKKFMADGLDPTCLSGTHLRLITDMSGPFLFGRQNQ